MVSLVLPPPLGLFLSLIPRSLLSGYTRDTGERGHAHEMTEIQIQDAEIKAAADGHGDAEEKVFHNWSAGGGHGGAAVMVETVKKVIVRVRRNAKTPFAAIVAGARPVQPVQVRICAAHATAS